MSPRFFWIAANRYADGLPPPRTALREPNGLLAAHGDLAPATLLAAYRQGVFPWYSPGQPLLWWSPDPRAVFWPDRVHVSRSLARTLRRGLFEFSVDRDFAGVIDGCAEPRGDGAGTWIDAAMRAAYLRLHALGHAHSFESRHEGKLVGGVYGVAIGRVFYGESMFSRMPDASKAALVTLCRRLVEWDYALFDCQVGNPHLASLGAVALTRDEFTARLATLCTQDAAESAWQAHTEATRR
jgi:leucyl/phenylalanyl-tRNA--protein transferase